MNAGVDEAIECPICGTHDQMFIIQSVNVARMPEAKEHLLEGTFMHHTCGACQTLLEVERDLLWLDFDGKLMILCFERFKEADIHACEEQAIEVFRKAAWDNCPPVVRQLGTTMSLRVVFGHDQLREKVLCREHSLDDKMIEFLKLAMLVAHPDWQRPTFDGLRLVEVRPETLIFVRDVDGLEPQVEVQRAMLDKIEAEPDLFIEWAPQVWEGPYVNAKRVHLFLPEAEAFTPPGGGVASLFAQFATDQPDVDLAGLLGATELEPDD